MGNGATPRLSRRGNREAHESRAKEGCKKKKEVDLLEFWSYIEADFQREYRVDLVTAIQAMTYRKFRVLLNGLSKDSLWAMLNSMEDEGPKIIEDPQEAQAAVYAIWGLDKKK